jgi:hypothetical protein
LLAARGRGQCPKNAFATIRREDFLGPGPWLILRWTRYVATPDADPVYLYTNDLVALVSERNLNNGQPSLHAYLIRQKQIHGRSDNASAHDSNVRWRPNSTLC